MVSGGPTTVGCGRADIHLATLTPSSTTSSARTKSKPSAQPWLTRKTELRMPWNLTISRSVASFFAISVLSLSPILQGWTSFTFPGRNLKDESTGVTPGDSGVLKYSNFKWDFNHFTGVDWDAKGETSAIFRIDGKNKGWALAVDHEDGNYDYLSESSPTSF